MTTENDITPERVRVLLEAMGYQEIGDDYYHAPNDINKHGPHLTWYMDHCAEPWFLLACLRFMESEKVRAAGRIRVVSNSWGGLKADPDMEVSMRDESGGRVGNRWIFTGPLETRIPQAAMRVAEILKEAKRVDPAS